MGNLSSYCRKGIPCSQGANHPLKCFNVRSINISQQMYRYPEQFQEIQGKHFIDGQFVDSKGQDTFLVINPATEEPIGKASAGNQKDVELAVEAAQKAFQSWKSTDAHARGRILLKISELLMKELDLLAYNESLNCGKPISKTTGF